MRKKCSNLGFGDKNDWSGAKGASLAAQKTKVDKEDIDYPSWKENIVK